MGDPEGGGPLALDDLGDGVGSASMMRGRIGQIFGGQLAAHSMTAGARACGGLAPHSLHLLFLAAGDSDRPVHFRTTPVRSGRAIAVARVDAVQGDALLATAVVSCHSDEVSGEHGVRAEDVPSPDDCSPLDFGRIGGDSPVWSTVDARYVELASGPAPSLRLWLRWTAPLPDGHVSHASALVWMSDLAMLRTARLASASDEVWARPGASLDHSVWLHRPARADEWLLLDVSSPVRAGARSLSEARLFDPDGMLVASSTQECLVRDL